MPRELLVKRFYDENKEDKLFEQTSSASKYASLAFNKDNLSRKSQSKGNEENRQNIGNKKGYNAKILDNKAEKNIALNQAPCRVHNDVYKDNGDKIEEKNNNGKNP